jgi:hypothetical protein
MKIQDEDNAMERERDQRPASTDRILKIECQFGTFWTYESIYNKLLSLNNETSTDTSKEKSR